MNFKEVIRQVLNYVEKNMTASDYGCFKHLIEIGDSGDRKQIKNDDVYLDIIQDLYYYLEENVVNPYKDDVFSIIQKANRKFFFETGDMRYRLYGAAR